MKVGAEYRHTSIDMVQAIAPNAFYVFAGTFPTNNAIANLLLGAPVTFYQGLGDFSRGVRAWGVAAYAQDEWRVMPRDHAQLRAPLRAHQPPDGGRGSPEHLHPGRAIRGQAGCARRAAVPRRPGHRTRHRRERPRVHAARRRGVGSDRLRHLVGPGELRPLLRSVSERGGHGVAGRDQRDALGPVRPVQRRGLELPEPVSGASDPGARDVRPALDGVRARRRDRPAVRAELER